MSQCRVSLIFTRLPRVRCSWSARGYLSKLPSAGGSHWPPCAPTPVQGLNRNFWEQLLLKGWDRPWTCPRGSPATDPSAEVTRSGGRGGQCGWKRGRWLRRFWGLWPCAAPAPWEGPWAALMVPHAAQPLFLEAEPMPRLPVHELWGTGFMACSSTGSAGPGLPREPGQSWWLHPWGVRELDSRRPKVQVSRPGARALCPGAGPVPRALT